MEKNIFENVGQQLTALKEKSNANLHILRS